MISLNAPSEILDSFWRFLEIFKILPQNLTFVKSRETQIHLHFSTHFKDLYLLTEASDGEELGNQ